MFKGRKLLIATKHRKEKVIAPILEKELGVKCFTTDEFDTDKLGTFSGEVEREFDPITTLRKKCAWAMELTNCDLAIASEGSFGPHPSMYFVPADDEFLIFIDKKNDLEIIVRELSTDTNFKGAEIKTEEELIALATMAKFPEHALILKNKKENFTAIVKGITDFVHLKSSFANFISNYGEAFIETDMRAMHNPTRMKVIEKATVKLVNKINSLCPKCDMPGFGITEAIQGLPCESCNFPTRTIMSHVYTCAKCGYKKTEQFPFGKKSEDPMYCDICNT